MDEKLIDGATALAEKQPRVIKIEPAERPQNVRLRVAAYTRVSSDSEDQLSSCCGVLERTVPGHDRLLSAQCAPDAELLAIV